MIFDFFFETNNPKHKKRKGKLQSVIIYKSYANYSLARAKQLAKKFGAKKVSKVHPKKATWRFRQLEPEQFRKFKVKKIGIKKVVLTYGIK